MNRNNEEATEILDNSFVIQKPSKKKYPETRISMPAPRTSMILENASKQRTKLMRSFIDHDTTFQAKASLKPFSIDSFLMHSSSIKKSNSFKK